MKYVQVFRKIKYARNQIVYSEGEPSKYVYMSTEGEFELIKSFPNKSSTNRQRLLKQKGCL